MAKASFFGKLPLFYAIAGTPIPLALATIAVNLAVCVSTSKKPGPGGMRMGKIEEREDGRIIPKLWP